MEICREASRLKNCVCLYLVLTNAGQKYIPSVYDALKAQNIQIVSARDRLQGFGVAQRWWKLKVFQQLLSELLGTCIANDEPFSILSIGDGEGERSACLSLCKEFGWRNSSTTFKSLKLLSAPSCNQLISQHLLIHKNLRSILQKSYSLDMTVIHGQLVNDSLVDETEEVEPTADVILGDPATVVEPGATASSHLSDSANSGSANSTYVPTKCGKPGLTPPRSTFTHGPLQESSMPSSVDYSPPFSAGETPSVAHTACQPVPSNSNGRAHIPSCSFPSSELTTGLQPAYTDHTVYAAAAAVIEPPPSTDSFIDRISEQLKQQH